MRIERMNSYTIPDQEKKFIVGLQLISLKEFDRSDEFKCHVAEFDQESRKVVVRDFHRPRPENAQNEDNVIEIGINFKNES